MTIAEETEMIWLLVSSIVIYLTAWLYARWLKVKSYWAERSVPYPLPHPIYGSLTFLQKINPGLWMRQMYEHFQSPYIGIWLFWRPDLVVNCPEIGHNILVKDSANFRNRFLSSDSHDPIGSLNIFTSNDPHWSNVRRRLTPVFTSAKLKSVQTLMNLKSMELIQRIAMESKKGKFNYRAVLNDYTSDVIGTASFGIKNDATLTGDSVIRTVTKDFEKFTLWRGMAWSCIFFFPELVKPFGFTFFPKKTIDNFRKVFKAIVEKRMDEELNEIVEPRDLLDILLKMKKDMIEETGEFTDDILLSQASVFLLGGFDTSGSQITFAMYELAHHPNIQEKLYQELKRTKEINKGTDFDESTLANITFLNCVIKEVMRKYHPMGWLDRVATKDYAIDDKLTIPAGTPVYVNAIGMHYDPNYFPDPNRFDPDRFLPENEANIKKFTFLPFGDGPRSCIGQRFGNTSVRTALILNYELRPVPNTPKPSEVQIERNNLFLVPGEIMYVDFVPRI